MRKLALQQFSLPTRSGASLGVPHADAAPAGLQLGVQCYNQACCSIALPRCSRRACQHTQSLRTAGPDARVQHAVPARAPEPRSRDRRARPSSGASSVAEACVHVNKNNLNGARTSLAYSPSTASCMICVSIARWH